MLDTAFGLPLHVLLIHAVVVVIPVVAVASVVVTVRQQWARRLLPWLCGASAGCMVLVYVTVSSGRRFAERLPESAAIDRHAALGNQLLWLTAGLVVLVGAATFWSWRYSMLATKSGLLWSRGLRTALAVMAMVVTVQVVRTGHSGAAAVWGPIVDAANA